MLAVAHNFVLNRYSGNPKLTLEYDWLDDNGLANRHVFTVEDVKPAWKDLRMSALRVYSATEFSAEPGEHCMWCPLKCECQPDDSSTLEDLDQFFG